jgi:hypothetical protein
MFDKKSFPTSPPKHVMVVSSSYAIRTTDVVDRDGWVRHPILRGKKWCAFVSRIASRRPSDVSPPHYVSHELARCLSRLITCSSAPLRRARFDADRFLAVSEGLHVFREAARVPPQHMSLVPDILPVNPLPVKPLQPPPQSPQSSSVSSSTRPPPASWTSASGSAAPAPAHSWGRALCLSLF